MTMMKINNRMIATPMANMTIEVPSTDVEVLSDLPPSLEISTSLDGRWVGIELGMWLGVTVGKRLGATDGSRVGYAEGRDVGKSIVKLTLAMIEGKIVG